MVIDVIRRKQRRMVDQVVLEATGKLIEEIKKSSVFKEYNFQKEKLKKQPKLFEKVSEYRRKNFALQTATHPDELFDKMDAFEKEYEQFRENPLVDDFLRAELAFCRMMQEVNGRIMAEIDFE